MALSVRFDALRTSELRELLEDEHSINDIIMCSEKFQQLQKAADKMLDSNQRLAKVGLSQKPSFRDAKLLLAAKYKELDKLRGIVRTKQEQLAEECSVHYAQWSLLRRINQAEEECELLFQRVAAGLTRLEDFLDSCLSLRTLHHIGLVLVRKLQEMVELRLKRRRRENRPATLSLSARYPVVAHNTFLPVCSLTTAVLLPVCCHPPFLMPFGIHVNTSHCQRHSPFSLDHIEPLHAGGQRRVPEQRARPVRLQPLKAHQTRHQQAPPWNPN